MFETSAKKLTKSAAAVTVRASDISDIVNIARNIRHVTINIIIIIDSNLL